ncbi:hypothetical protein GPECTOR_8g215 [Gonium pectorale]|uniref:Uncharacterized protein n=1 Tax=Gonium pectorale TaxID=33097 RepID=A0A150GSY7_GONPE|nr:hypothetical protein GPECTOR_8g215 [Gonium pectorale]|eukprot:KXZ52832.1 hypothetical protein GPECTOR_8g215 [Gonium pectorale]
MAHPPWSSRSAARPVLWADSLAGAARHNKESDETIAVVSKLSADSRRGAPSASHATGGGRKVEPGSGQHAGKKAQAPQDSTQQQQQTQQQAKLQAKQQQRQAPQQVQLQKPAAATATGAKPAEKVTAAAKAAAPQLKDQQQQPRQKEQQQQQRLKAGNGAAETVQTAHKVAIQEPKGSAGVAKKLVGAASSARDLSEKPGFPPFAKPVVPYTDRVANPPSIVGVVFYGRRDRVRILDCYLQRNLVRSGGLLSEVVFVTATWQPQDVTFLEKLIQIRAPDYKKLVPQRLDKGYTGHYAWMDPAQLYVKIDDDVVYIGDDAIDHMLAAHMLNRYHLISANVINHQPLELPHSQKSAHWTYEQAVPDDKSSWRLQMRAPATAPGAAAGHPAPVPFRDNGWETWGDWRKAANVHYSFLANQAAGRLSVYEFPHEQLWDFNKHFGYTRWRINMIMFQGATIDVHVYNMSSTTGTYPGDDEDFITRILPQQLNKTSAAVSRALAVHFSFYMQRAGLENSTDLLDRYALLAENTCGRLVPAGV